MVETEKWIENRGINLEKNKNNKNLYKAVFESMTESFMIGKVILKEGKLYDFKYLFVNQAAASAIGMKKEEVENKNFKELLPEKDIKDLFSDKKVPQLERIGNAVLNGESIKNEEIQNPITGKWLEFDAYPQGKNTFAIYARDITEHKKAEEALKESEERYRTLVETLPDAIIVHSDGVIRFVNPAAVKLLKANDEKEIIGKSILSLTTEEFRDIVKKRIKQAEYEQTPLIELKLVKLDGSIIYVEVTGKNIIYQNKSATQIIMRDVTERKKADEELKVSEERYKSLAENIDSILMRYDKDLRVVYLSPKAEEITGIPTEEFIGKTNREVGMPENLSNLWEKAINNVFKSGEMRALEFDIPTDERKKTFYLKLSPEFNLNGSVDYVLGISTDITKRKKAEEVLKEAHDNLEVKVEERTAELEEMNVFLKDNEIKLKDAISELEHSNRELASFAYITSHDLQEPLRTIASFTQLLERRYKGQLDNDADEFMDYIVEAAKRMKAQIEGLLEYSQIDRTDEEFVKIDMNEMVEKAQSNLHSVVEKSNAEITHDNLPIVHANSNQMVRGFQNLIGNAIKFKKPQFPPRIHISAKKENNEYVFSVEDKGIGMDPQYSKKIFDVFKRLHTRDEYEGTGIGLSIVKKIIESNGGSIWVESELDVGSTFYFTLPVRD